MSKLEDSSRRARALWKHRGEARPSFAVEPGPGQESVWDYPRPPVIVPDARRIRVLAGTVTLAELHAPRAAWACGRRLDMSPGPWARLLFRRGVSPDAARRRICRGSDLDGDRAIGEIDIRLARLWLGARAGSIAPALPSGGNEAPLPETGRPSDRGLDQAEFLVVVVLLMAGLIVVRWLK